MYDFYFHSFTTLLLAYISNIQIMFPHLKSCVRCIILVNVWIDGDLNTHLAQQYKYKGEGSGNKRESDIVILSFWSIFLQEYKTLKKYFGQSGKIILAWLDMRSILIQYLYCFRSNNCTRRKNPVYISYVLCLNTILYLLNAYILLKIRLRYQKKIALLENKLVFIWFRNLKSNILLTFANVPIFSWPNLNSLSSTVHKALSYTNFFFRSQKLKFPCIKF